MTCPSTLKWLLKKMHWLEHWPGTDQPGFGARKKKATRLEGFMTNT